MKIFYSSNSIKLGDIFELKSGYAFKSKDWVDEGKPVIKIKDIDGITVDITNLNYVKNKSQLSKASNFEVFGKEIVMALTGATTGKIGVIPKNFIPSPISAALIQVSAASGTLMVGGARSG
ncbi:MAG: restriction endonuclease subunit S, partial [Streptococcus sp.]|nr:restriction endonuclease subunit S [Streptococcus sp.]